MSWIKTLFIRNTNPNNPNPVGYGSFGEWYLQYRVEMAKKFNVNYAISIASWTFSEHHRKYFDRGLSPIEAVSQYILDKTNAL